MDLLSTLDIVAAEVEPFDRKLAAEIDEVAVSIKDEGSTVSEILDDVSEQLDGTALATEIDNVALTIDEGESNAGPFDEAEVELIFSSKEKARELGLKLVKLDKSSDVRLSGKPSVRKTKGWKTYSLFVKFHSLADRAEFGKRRLYVPEKPHYKDISSKK